LPGVEELFGPEVACFEGSGERVLTSDGDGDGLHEDRADVVVEAVELVAVVVPMLQLEGAVSVGSDPALAAGVAVCGSREGTDVDEGSPAQAGGWCLGDQAPAQTQRGQFVGRPRGPIVARCHAATWSLGRSTSCPWRKVAPARTSATRWGALTAPPPGL